MQEDFETPAFVLDLRVVQAQADAYARIHSETGVRVLYATKPLLHAEVLSFLADRLDGLTASSLLSASLCREILGERGTLAIVTPGYRESEIESVGDLCDQVVLNSLSQWERFGETLRMRTSVGLRVNPGLSYLPDVRYDPGRANSKLGVPLSLLAQTSTGVLHGIEGLHFHSNCDAPNYEPLHETVQSVATTLDHLLKDMRWINLGGGYRLPHPDEWVTLYRTVDFLHQRYPQATIYMEPGSSLVREAGTLIASVVDLFDTGSGRIAVLDTTVNHLPEVFEYQYRPKVIGHDDGHPHSVTLAGATCLAGDIFGEYRFAEPLTLGSRIVFPNVGAYTLAKAHWFNGIALPTLYTIDLEGHCHLRHRFGLTGYRQQLGWPISD